MDIMSGVEIINGKGHKDVFIHTLQVVDNAAKLSNKMEIRFAALVHDIAKPPTKRFNKSKGWTFHGHDEIGRRMLKKVASRMKLPNNLRDYLKFKNENPNQPLPTDLLVANFDLKPLFKNQEHINLIKDAMFSSSNEPGGTSYRHRFENPKYTFAGKTGSSQIKRFTEAQREAEVKQKDIEYKDRDHALFVAFAPYKNPQYAISVLVEHGGSGGKAAAPIARKVIKKVLERHELRERVNQLIGEPV